jgi:hypothetical protein
MKNPWQVFETGSFPCLVKDALREERVHSPSGVCTAAYTGILFEPCQLVHQTEHSRVWQQATSVSASQLNSGPRPTSP